MLYLFNKNEELIYELPKSEIESLIQHEELNKLMTLEFSVYTEFNKKMENIVYVGHKDMENYEKIQMYRLITSESDDYKVNYQAVHIIFDELKAYGYIRDKRPDKVKASQALEIALDGSRWEVGRVDDSELLSTNFYDLSRLDALSEILKTWNLDLNFYLTFDGNKISGRYIDLLSFRGEDTGERFVYGSNALEVVKEEDVSEVCTRVIPRGKGEEKLDEDGKPTDGYGRRIKIDEVIWAKSKGDPIDKPKGQEYLELIEMTQKFGFSDGEPRTKVQIFEDIEDPKELIKAGYDFLVKVSRPLVQFRTKIEKRSRTNVGDIVRIIRKDLDLYYRTRIYKALRNLLDNTLEVEFGDKLVISQADREKILNDSLNSLEDKLKESEIDIKSSFIDKVVDGINKATFNRDGYNYELKKGNKYGLPAGYYSFDREIDDNPQRVIYVGAGTMAIADSKKSNGDWNFRTFGTGEGFTADLIVAGMLRGGKVKWNLEDGTFLIGNSLDDYSMYWNGSKLYINADIDISSNAEIKSIKNDLSNLGMKVNDISVGGRNLIKDSKGELKYIGYNGGTIKIKEKNFKFDNLSDEGISLTINGSNATGNLKGLISLKYNLSKDLEVGKTYTMSFYMKNRSETTTMYIALQGFNNKTFYFDYLEEKEIVYTGKYDGQSLQIQFFSDKDFGIYPSYTNLKLEEGNTKTTWTPAYEDLLDSLKDIQNLANKNKENFVNINANVNNLTTKQQEDVSKLLSTVEAIRIINSQATDEQKASLDTLEDYIRNKLEDVESGISNSQIGFDELNNILNQYIENLPSEIKKKINEDEFLIQAKKNFSFNSDGLVIGADASRFNVKLDNEQLTFYQDSEQIAYINGNRLFITSAHILENFRIYNLVFQRYEGTNSNGETEKFVYINMIGE